MQVAVGMRVRRERGLATDVQEDLFVAPQRQGGGGLAPWIDPGGKADRVAGQDRGRAVRMAAPARTVPARVVTAMTFAVRSTRSAGVASRKVVEDGRLEATRVP